MKTKAAMVPEMWPRCIERACSCESLLSLTTGFLFSRKGLLGSTCVLLGPLNADGGLSSPRGRQLPPRRRRSPG